MCKTLLTDFMPCRSQWNTDYRPVVFIQLCLALLSLTPAVTETCCTHFFLEISFPSLRWLFFPDSVNLQAFVLGQKRACSQKAWKIGV